jgi:hypothetical protein
MRITQTQLYQSQRYHLLMISYRYMCTTGIDQDSNPSSPEGISNHATSYNVLKLNAATNKNTFTQINNAPRPPCCLSHWPSQHMASNFKSHNAVSFSVQQWGVFPRPLPRISPASRSEKVFPEFISGLMFWRYRVACPARPAYRTASTSRGLHVVCSLQSKCDGTR